jgi:group I intron endonuclease
VSTRFTFYCHTNKVNGKRYVGQTTGTMESRWTEHVHAARQQRGSRLLGAAIRKYGPDAFDHEVLEVIVATQQEADLVETGWIGRKASRAPSGYNLTAGGGSNGLHHEDTKRLIGESSKRRLEEMTDEQQIAFFQKNIHLWTPERLTRQLARVQSKEVREKVSSAQKDFWAQFSPEEKSARVRHQLAGMSAEKKSARVRKAWANATPEARAERVSKAQEAGRKVGPLRSEKMRQFQLARQATLTPEQRSETGQKAWATRLARYGESGVKDPAADRNGSAKMTPEARSERLRKGWANMTPEARAERVHKINEGRRLARLKKVAGSQLIDAELLPFVRHWHLRGHSIESIASAFNVSTGEIDRAVA